MVPKYTVGFVFNKEHTHVLLILKNRPDWQKGNYNGPGGKIEEGETSLDCVAREILEETNLDIKAKEWTLVCNIESSTFDVDFYGATHTGNLGDAKKTTDEEIEWVKVSKLPKNIIQNLRYLIPVTLNKIGGDDFEVFQVKYKK